MPMFESIIVIDSSVQQCVKTWQECVNAWVSNESFLDFEPLTRFLRKNNVKQSQYSPIEWDIAANSNEHHQVLSWHNSSIIDTFGVIVFDEVEQGPSHQTRVTLKVTLQKALNGLNGFRVETTAGLALQRALKQFKRIVASNAEQSSKLYRSDDEMQKNLDILFPENFRKDVIYEAV